MVHHTDPLATSRKQEADSSAARMLAGISGLARFLRLEFRDFAAPHMTKCGLGAEVSPLPVQLGNVTRIPEVLGRQRA